MREILFRGKSKNSNKWVYGWYCGKTLNHDMSDTEESSQIIDFKTLYWHTCRPETVGQYTWLTDKNGKKIFEGDIIRAFGEIYACRWDDGNVEFGLSNKHESFGIAYVAGYDMEVIGNIHDNLELLEE